MKKKIREKSPDKIWADFKAEAKLTDAQLEKFQKYEAILSEWNKLMNLTSISGTSETVHRHFVDSLILGQFLDLSTVKILVDVGSGAGFPGIPLKIMFPHLGLILIEVTKKKQRFLRMIISELELENIEVCDLDWRTFLRKTESEVDYFLARASIDPVELSRLFKPGSVYKHAQLVYWATADWQPEASISHLVKEEFAYKIKRKERKLVLIGNSKNV